MKNTVKKFSLTKIFEAAAACVRLSPAVLKLGTFAHDYGQKPHGVDLEELKATIDSLSLSIADLAVVDEEDEGIDVGMVSSAVNDFYVSVVELAASDVEEDEGIDLADISAEINKIRISLVSNSAEGAGEFLTCVGVDMPAGTAVIAMIQEDGKCLPSFTAKIKTDELNAILEHADANVFLPHTRHTGQRVIVFSGRNAINVFDAAIDAQVAVFKHEMFLTCGHTCMVTGIDGLHSPVMLEAVHVDGDFVNERWWLRNKLGYLMHRSIAKEYKNGRLNIINGMIDVCPTLYQDEGLNGFNWANIQGKKIEMVYLHDPHTWPIFKDDDVIKRFPEAQEEYFNFSNGLDGYTHEVLKSTINF